LSTLLRNEFSGVIPWKGCGGILRGVQLAATHR